MVEPGYKAVRPGQLVRKHETPVGIEPCKVSLTEQELQRFRAWGIEPDEGYGRVPRRSSVWRQRHQDERED